MRNRGAFAFFQVGLVIISLLEAGIAGGRDSLAEVATGEGTLIFNNEEQLRVHAVVVLLKESGAAEVSLITKEADVNLGGRWLRRVGARSEIVLVITDDTAGGLATGIGRLLLQGGCVPLARLTMTGSKPDGTTFHADFIEKKSRPCGDPG